MSQPHCEYCGQEERYGHNAICVMNTVEELRAEIERLRALSQNNAHSWDALVKVRNDLQAEIERLRLWLGLAVQRLDAIGGHHDIAVEARRALEPKP